LLYGVCPSQPPATHSASWLPWVPSGATLPAFAAPGIVSVYG
jgi:hypothetical protein